MDYENVCASLGFEPDTFGVESNRFINSATPPYKLKVKENVFICCRTRASPKSRQNLYCKKPLYKNIENC